MTKYADTRLGNGVHTKNGQTRVTDSGGAKDTDSAQLCKTQTKHHPIDKGYAWVVLAGKYIRELQISFPIIDPLIFVKFTYLSR